MNFQEAEKTYRDLKQQHAAGKLTDEDLEAQVAELWCQDAQGHWWQLGVQSGEWYMYDGQKWNKAKPPTAPAATAAPLPTDSGAAAEGDTAQTDTRGGAPPARQGAAPMGGSTGIGLPTPMLIGMIAVVAVVAILIVMGGYFAISSMLGGSAFARATTTPTRVLALVPSPVMPTLTLAIPIDTPLPPPTIQVTPTHTATRPTATKRPTTPTPARPGATATANIPPGVYVTNIETIPAQVNLGDTIGFKVSFLNTTGSIQTYDWLVKVYQCPEQCQDFKHSHGETLPMNSNVAAGTSVLSTTQNISIRTGISCSLIAIATYVDPVNQLPTPFQATRNDGRFSFSPCH